MKYYDSTISFRPESNADNKYFWSIYIREELLDRGDIIACGWERSWHEASKKCYLKLKEYGTL